jgi:dTDP-4-dehydrorhamnose reductase
MRLLIVGASGQVGASLGRIAASGGHTVLGSFVSRPPPLPSERTARLDKSRPETISPALERLRPEVVVDTGALHQVDYCETHEEEALRVNRDGTGALAKVARAIGARFLFVSTDFVFDGNTDRPYVETDRAEPLSVYGRSKLAGEAEALQNNPETIVVRPSVVYSWIPPAARIASISQKGVNFASWVIDELTAGRSLSIVNDQIASPTLSEDLARAILVLLERKESGVFHAAGSTPLSRFEFTLRLAQRLGLDDSKVHPIGTPELHQAAPRPANSSLDSSKLAQRTGCTLSALEPALELLWASWERSR